MGDPLIKGLEAKVLSICESNPQGLSDVEITKKLESDVKVVHRLTVYNNLLQKGRLALVERRSPNGGKPIVLYQWVSKKEAEKYKGLDKSERMVYNLIENAGQEGLTKKDMKYRTNIQNTAELKQIVERLISRGLIKEVKSVQGTNKRVYILAELEPSTLHTGGPWYNDEQEFDTEFINAIYEQVLAFIQTVEYVNVEQVTNYVAELKVSNEALVQSDMKALINTMLYDGAIEQCTGRKDGTEYFRHTRPTPAVNHLASIPCGSCPVFRDCAPGGVISPEKCAYMDEWLKQTADW